MYEFLADEFWWRHTKEIDKALDNVKVKFTVGGYKASYLPDISWAEAQAVRVPKTIVYNGETKPVYVIVAKDFPFVCWLKIK